MYKGFSVPSEWDWAEAQGRFRAEGGSGNDIIVYIVDEDGFENFKNGHSTATYYNSGKVTVANIGARLKPGNYVIIMDNQFSLSSNKVVSITCQIARR